MSSSISPTSAYFAGWSLLGGWRIGRPAPLSLRWYKVCPYVVIALHNKDVSILDEFFQLLGFSITQVWPGCSNHILKLWGSVLDVWLFNIGLEGGGHQCDWLTVCQWGAFHELLVTTGSFLDLCGYLSTVSDHSPGNLESFGSMDLRTRFYQAFFHSMGLQSSH